MIEPGQLVGRRLALLLAGEDEQGEDDWAVFAGTIRDNGGRLCWDHERGTLELRNEWLEWIQPVTAEVKDTLLGADLVLALSVGDLPEGASLRGLEPTGLKWPSGRDA